MSVVLSLHDVPKTYSELTKMGGGGGYKQSLGGYGLPGHPRNDGTGKKSMQSMTS